MQLSLEEMRKAGAEVVAISPDPPDVSRGLASKMGLGYRLLSDADLAVTDAWGVRHRGAMRPGESDIPRPAVFVVDGRGVVVFRHLTDNWRVRLRPERLIAVLARTP